MASTSAAEDPLVEVDMMRATAGGGSAAVGDRHQKENTISPNLAGMAPPAAPNALDFVTSSMPPLQFLHVPARPSSTRKQQPHLPTKAPIPVFTLKNLPDLATMKATMSHPPVQPVTSSQRPGTSESYGRPPTAPSSDLGTAATSSRENSARGVAHTARSLFGSAAGARLSRLGSGCTSGGIAATPSTAKQHPTKPSPLSQSDVCWTTDESPRVASATKHRPPPLVIAIERHLKREMQFVEESCHVEACEVASPHRSGVSGETHSPGRQILIDPMQALQPHREAMRMLIEGLPSYASLLNSIMVAYDSVVKHQAVGASVARNISNSAVQIQQAHQGDVAKLKQTIDGLEQKCKDLHQALTVKSNEVKHANSNPTLHKLEKESVSLKEQIAALEYEKSCDLERLMTLIAAIKECDSRVKTLEDALQDAKIQLEEMHALRKMMGESQAELGLLKMTFRDAVPLIKFQNATRELESLLRESQQETKRVRRLCIARGSTIDILEKKLKVATEELDRFRMAAGSKAVRDALTPRPNWIAIQKQVPELTDFAADVPMSMLDGDALPRMAPGLKETSLQVEFLIEKIQELTTSNEMLKSQLNGVVSGGTNNDASLRSELSRHRQSIATSGIHGAASPSPTRGTAVTSTAAQNSAASLPQRPFMLGYGAKLSVPTYFRDVGLIPRIPLESSRVRELVHDFFSCTALRKNPDAALSFSEADLSRHLCSFIVQQFALSQDLRNKYHNSVPYLAYNLLLGQALPLLPQVLLMQHILEGTLPLAIPFAALDMEAQLQHELQKMCDVHNKTRLRKQIVLELFSSLFPFKPQHELDELKATLPMESTLDIPTLINARSRLMETLFEQECGQGLKMYLMFAEKITAASSLGSEQVRVVTTSAVLSAIAEVEPRTSQRVIDGLIEGGYEEERTFPLDFTIQALKTHMITRVGKGQAPESSA